MLGLLHASCLHSISKRGKTTQLQALHDHPPVCSKVNRCKEGEEREQQLPAPVLGTSRACCAGARQPSTCTSVTRSVRTLEQGSGSVRYMKGSNLTLLKPQSGHTSVLLYRPCAGGRHAGASQLVGSWCLLRQLRAVLDPQPALGVCAKACG